MFGLVRFYVARNFADYVNRSLLERYSQVADALAVEYKTHRGWQDIKDDPEHWQEILQTSLPKKKFDDGSGPPQPIETKFNGLSSRAQDRPSQGSFRRIQRLARRLALFDFDKQHIAGGRSKAMRDDFTLQAITVNGQTVGWLDLHKKEHLANPLAVGFLSQQSHMLYMIGVGILLLTAVVTFLLSRHLLAPVDKLMTGTQALMSRRFDTRIKNLRKKIAQKLPDQEIISTVYGIGYKLTATFDESTFQPINCSTRSGSITTGK
jgi:two-component system sensor histidine kinase BaeS